ncbi:MAG: STAS/SEC14 domain-containing protein [Pleurocapsa sp.]
MTIRLIPHKPDQIIGLNIDGKIETEDLDRIIQSIDNKLKQGQKLRIYVEVKNWSGMSIEAFIQDLRFSWQHFQDFEKEAIVSDHLWLKTLAAVGNTLFSGIEVKHFTFDQRDQALEWISS